jgi:hypothetical protein
MQGFANERGLRPIFDNGVDALGAERRAALSLGSVPQPERHRALYLLDGIGGLGWSVIGFVGGAVFWHFVGFWGFVSDVVLAEAPSPAVNAATHAPLASRSHWLQVADASQTPCTLLVLDRRTGVTSARPCDRDHVPLPADSFQGREDRVIDGLMRADEAPAGADD